MTAPTRHALLRALSSQAEPGHRFIDIDAARLGEDFILLLRFAAEVTGQSAETLTPLDLMANLSSLKGARRA